MTTEHVCVMSTKTMLECTAQVKRFGPSAEQLLGELLARVTKPGERLMKDGKAATVVELNDGDSLELESSDGSRFKWALSSVVYWVFSGKLKWDFTEARQSG